MSAPNPLVKRLPEKTPRKHPAKVTKATFARVDAVLRWWAKREKEKAS